MANETIDQNNFSFGIQETMEMGMGNQDLLNDLLSPETSTADPLKVKEIKEEAAVVAKEPPAEPPVKPENALKSFLDSDDDNDDDDDKEDPEKTPGSTPPPPPIAPKPASVKKEEGDDDDDNVRTPFESISDELFEQGVFNKDEDEVVEPIKTAEAFLERFNLEKKKGAIQMVDNFIGQFGQDYQDAFQSIFVQGINPKDYFQTVNQIDDLSQMDMTVESNQEQIVRRALTDQGFEKEDVDSEVERLKSYGDLESVSQKHHKVLIKKDQASLAEKTKIAQEVQQQKQQSRQTYINNVNTVLENKIKEKTFDGIPLTPKTANELQDFLLVDKWKTDSGETLTDFDRYILDLKRPENHQMKVKVALVLKLLEKDPTLSTVQKTGVSKKTDTLFKEISRQVANNKSTKTDDDKSVGSWFASKP